MACSCQIPGVPKGCPHKKPKAATAKEILESPPLPRRVFEEAPASGPRGNLPRSIEATLRMLDVPFDAANRRRAALLADVIARQRQLLAHLPKTRK